MKMSRGRGGGGRGRSGRGGASAGRGRGRGRGRGANRRPFRSRDGSKSYSQISLEKRKSEQLYEEKNKKFKADVEEDVAPPSSSDSEPEEESQDGYARLMQVIDDDDRSNEDDSDEDNEDISEEEVDEEEEEEDGELASDEEELDEEQDEEECADDYDDAEESVDSSEANEEEIRPTQIPPKIKQSSKEKDKKKNGNSVLLEEEEAEEEALLPDQDDPFSHHFERCLSTESAELVQQLAQWQLQVCRVPALGVVQHRFPVRPQQSDATGKPRRRLLLTEDTAPPVFGSEINLPHPKKFDMDSCFIKQNIQKNVSELTDLQKQLLSIISKYTDLYYPEATYDKLDDVTTVYTIHVLNHVLKTRARILKNNSKLNRAKLNNMEVDESQFQDQGYARPKVLILVPTKHSAYRVVQRIISLLQLTDPSAVMNQRRFEDDFGPGDLAVGQTRSKRERPADFNATFTGDTNEDFKIGITITKKSMKLYSNFYSSDVILASPLGMRLTTGVEDEQDNDTGFLTSIELLIMDQADVFLMQNWEHAASVVLESVNQAFRSVEEVVSDSKRVRQWLIDGHAPLYRQTLLFSAIPNALHKALFATTRNFAGKLQVSPSVRDGVMSEVLVSAQLVLMRVPGFSDRELRLKHFTTQFMPQHVASKKAYTLLYITDYSDYYYINHYLSKERGIDFSSINEYMTGKMSQVAVARSDFFKGTSPLLLYSERFHFYKRPVIKGIRHLIFYDLPTYPHFFSEMCNMMLPAKQNSGASQDQKMLRSSITVFFQNSDSSKLVSVLGEANTKELLTSNSKIHLSSITGR